MASTGETWRLGRRPALDGLRGVAVLMVMASHLVAAGHIHALGPAGVVVFFALSGFLITALLLEERQRDGRASLTAFYMRRARRLLPAMLACIGAVAVVGLFVPGYSDRRLLTGALTYTANWVEAINGSSPSALGHLWSLAVEEQFYLVWPAVLLFLVRFPRRIQLDVVAALVVVTVLLPPLEALGGQNFDRIYYGSDTRAMPLLLGAGLAIWMHGRREVRVPSAGVIAAVAVAAIAAVSLSVSLPAVVLLLPQFVGLVTAWAIFAVVQGDTPDWLTRPWLVLVGQRSYALYLWHWPVYCLLNRALGDSGPVVLLVVGVPVSAGLAALSWRYVEARFLRPRMPVQAGAAPVPAMA